MGNNDDSDHLGDDEALPSSFPLTSALGLRLCLTSIIPQQAPFSLSSHPSLVQAFAASSTDPCHPPPSHRPTCPICQTSAYHPLLVHPEIQLRPHPEQFQRPMGPQSPPGGLTTTRLRSSMQRRGFSGTSLISDIPFQPMQGPL